MTTPLPSSRSFRPLIQAGTTAIREGDAHEALKLFEQAAALAVDDGQRAEAACMIGRCYGTLGRYADAETVLRDALQRAAHSPAVLAQAKMQMGIVRWQSGQLDQARVYLEDAEHSFRRLGDTRNRTVALGNLGMVLHSLGEYEPGMNAMQAALELSESLNNLTSVAIQCNNLGECYRDLGDPERAQDLHRRSITLAELLGSEGLQLDAWRNLGADLAELGEHDAAVDALARAMEQAQVFHQMDVYLQSLGSLAEVRLRRGERSDARRLAGQLIERTEDAPHRRAVGRLVLGQCQMADGDADAAVATLEAGLQDAQQSSGQMLVLRLHAALAGITTHAAIADVHRQIARDLVEQIARPLTDSALRGRFLASPLVRGIGGDSRAVP